MLQASNLTSASVNAELGRVCFLAMGNGGPINTGNRRPLYARGSPRTTVPLAAVVSPNISRVAAAVCGARRPSNNARISINDDNRDEGEPDVDYAHFQIFVMEKVIGSTVPTVT